MENPTQIVEINSESEILTRILQAFSVNDLKEAFNIDSSIRLQKDVIYNVLKGNNEKNIKNLLFKNYSLLKQHIYFYELQGKISDNLFWNHPFLYNTEIKQRGHKIFQFLFVEQYGIFNIDSGKIQNITFHRPVKVEIKGLKAIISINILERDLGSILNAKTINVNRKSNDNDILNSLTTFDKSVFFIKEDLNKGIKFLWANDYIDAYKVKFKKSKSTSSETMDEDHMVKKQMPDLYKEIMKSPLDITVFKYLKSDEYVKHFTANPREGIISFNTFPSTIKGIDEIIKLIVKNN